MASETTDMTWLLVGSRSDRSSSMHIYDIVELSHIYPYLYSLYTMVWSFFAEKVHDQKWNLPVSFASPWNGIVNSNLQSLPTSSSSSVIVNSQDTLEWPPIGKMHCTHTTIFIHRFIFWIYVWKYFLLHALTLVPMSSWSTIPMLLQVQVSCTLFTLEAWASNISRLACVQQSSDWYYTPLGAHNSWGQPITPMSIVLTACRKVNNYNVLLSTGFAILPLCWFFGPRQFLSLLFDIILFPARLF